MKKFFRLFALMAMLLTGLQQATAAGVVITYDFEANHPNYDVQMSDGYGVQRGNYKFFTGTYGIAFGNKIAFHVNADPILRSYGGFTFAQNMNKMFVRGLSVGDKVTILYDQGELYFCTDGTARLSAITTNGGLIQSSTAYEVSVAGDLCMQVYSKAVHMMRITIETVKKDERITMPYGIRTYCSANPLSFSGKRSIKAYIAKEYKNGRFVFEQVTYVPAFTGFLLMRRGTTTSFDVNIGRSSTYMDNYVPTNLFTGDVNPMTIPDDGKQHYVVGHTENVENIFKVNAGFPCNAKTAYLTIP